MHARVYVQAYHFLTRKNEYTCREKHLSKRPLSHALDAEGEARGFSTTFHVHRTRDLTRDLRNLRAAGSVEAR
jgi:hypothetical protein